MQTLTVQDEIRNAIRDVPDFPKPGIVFKDIMPVLSDKILFRKAIHVLSDPFMNRKVDVVVGIDARGFILGGAVAYKLGCGFVPVRKKGKLPYKCIEQSYTLEYGANTVALHEDAIRPGSQVLIVDDLLATGGTSAAAAQLVERLGGRIIEITFLVELSFLHGRKNLSNYKLSSTVVY